MKTLVELFDDSPILNILTSVAFHPEKLIFFGADAEQIKESKNDYIRFFERRHENIDIEFVQADMSDIKNVESVLESTITNNPDCVVDVTGGKDTALLAAGMSAVKLGAPLIAFDRQKNKYINVSNFDMAESVNIYGLLDCYDFFAASGGNVIECEDFHRYSDDSEKFWKKVIRVWNIYLKYMNVWASHVQYLQKVSSPALPDGQISLKVKGSSSINVNGREIYRNDRILKELNNCGAIENFKIEENGECSFSYSCTDFRKYLTDVGAFLELYIHACALQTGMFSSVLSRVKYNWEYASKQHNRYTVFRPASNEIDVIAIRGIEPLYISCKTSAPDMKYIDEIYPQAMRMSGGEGHAVFACTHVIDPDMPLYNKAKALGVFIIDGEDIKNRLVTKRLSQIAENSYIWKDEPEYRELLGRNE